MFTSTTTGVTCPLFLLMAKIVNSHDTYKKNRRGRMRLFFYHKDIYTVTKLKIHKIMRKNREKAVIYKTCKIQIPSLTDYK